MKTILLIVSLAIGGIAAARPRRAVGGRFILIDDEPYFVSITLCGEYIRGGVLITRNHVLSAARLTDQMRLSNVRVITGIDLRDTGGTSHEVRDIVRPRQNISTLSAANPQDDIAIFILSSEARHRPINLPNEEPRHGTKASLVAFRTSRNFPRSGDYLVRVETTIAQTNDCIGNDPVALASYSTIICAKNNPDSGMTADDAGSPLVYDGTLIGIASWSDRHDRNVEFYTNVYKYLPFIRGVTGRQDQSRFSKLKSFFRLQ